MTNNTCKLHQPGPELENEELVELPATLSFRTWRVESVISRLLIFDSHLALMKRSFSSLGVSGPGFFSPGCNLE